MSGVSKLTEGLASKREEVIIEFNGEQLKFYATTIGFGDVMKSAMQKTEESDGALQLINIVVASITDEEGNHFTAEQVRNLDAEIGRKLLDAVIEVNSRGEAGKK